MNTKLRNIQKSNLILERRLIENSEVEPLSELSSLNNILSQVGVPNISPDELDELSPECPVEIPDNPYKDIVVKLQDKINNISDTNVLKSLLQTIKDNSSKESKVQEQVGALGTTVMILGIAIPGPAFLIIAGTLTLIIVLQLAKLLFSTKTIKRKSAGYSTCKRRRKLVKKFGLDAYFM